MVVDVVVVVTGASVDGAVSLAGRLILVGRGGAVSLAGRLILVRRDGAPLPDPLSEESPEN